MEHVAPAQTWEQRASRADGRASAWAPSGLFSLLSTASGETGGAFLFKEKIDDREGVGEVSPRVEPSARGPRLLLVTG